MVVEKNQVMRDLRMDSFMISLYKKSPRIVGF
jgi:hypothetical protein